LAPSNKNQLKRKNSLIQINSKEDEKEELNGPLKGCSKMEGAN
jgi:hypothetical protein